MKTIEELYKLACKFGVQHAPAVLFEDPETGLLQFATKFEDGAGYSITVTEHGAEVTHVDGFGEPEIVEYMPHEGE